jgi:hypothetical protein
MTRSSQRAMLGTGGGVPKFPVGSPTRVGRPIKSFLPEPTAKLVEVERTPADHPGIEKTRASYDTDGDGKADVHVTRTHASARVFGSVDSFTIEEEKDGAYNLLWGQDGGRVRLEQRSSPTGAFEDIRDEDGDGSVDAYARGKFNALTIRLRGFEAERAARADEPEPPPAAPIDPDVNNT